MAENPQFRFWVIEIKPGSGHEYVLSCYLCLIGYDSLGFIIKKAFK